MRLSLGQPRIDGPLHTRAARRLLAWLLAVVAAAVLRRYRPLVVVVTGSVGKTTTKDLVAAALASRFRLRATRGSANSEIGAPISVIGSSRDRSPRGRALALLDGLRLLIRRRPFPELLVLELAAGRRGELDRLTRWIRPHVAVVTNVRPVHRQYYSNFEEIVREKSWPIRRLHSSGVGVLNVADPGARRLLALAPGRVLTYGSAGEADLWLDDVQADVDGMSAVVCIRRPEGGEVDRFRLSSALLGEHQLTGVLAAVGVGIALGVPPQQALDAVSGYAPADGRLRALRRADGLIVLDDSHNASPQAVLDALDVLARFPQPRWAVLGDMMTLGPEAEAGHRAVGEAVATRADVLVAVGEHADWIAETALSRGMQPSNVLRAPDAETAAQMVAPRTHGGTVLVKGSLAMQLGTVVAALVPGDTPPEPARRPGATSPWRGIRSRRRASSQ